MTLGGFPFILAREVDNRERPVVCSVSMDGCIASLKRTIYDTEGRVSQLALTNGTTNTIENFWGPDLSGTEQGAGGIGGLIATSVNGQLYFPTYDHNGNITAYYDATGARVAWYVYDAFGNTITQGGTMADAFSFRFSTKYWDAETGMYYYGHRFYVPWMGRWLNRDRVEEQGGANVYLSNLNNFFYFIDSHGNSAIVFLYDSNDPLFLDWVVSVKNRIQKNEKTYYLDSSTKYNPVFDAFYPVPVHDPLDVAMLRGISDVKYLGSFGHGADGKIWWNYKDASARDGYRSVATGVPNHKLIDSTIVDRAQIENLLLDFHKCHFVVEFYHCKTAREFAADENGNLVFSTNSKHPDIATDDSANKTSVISYYKSLLDAKYAGTFMTYNINGSVEGVSNGKLLNRGYPRPLGEIKNEQKNDGVF